MYFPDKAMFYPEKYGLDDLKKINYVTQDHVEITGYFAPPKDQRRLTIVFFQGNAGNMSLRVDKIRLWRDQGYGVMLAPYRGYQGNRGQPDENGLYNDARAAIDALKAGGLDESTMLLYGESLGTGVAVQIGTYYKTAALVLEVPYTSIADVGSQRYPFVPIFWLLQDKYMSVDKIKNIKSPILVLKAGKDSVIPPEFAQKLYDTANEPKRLIVNPGAGHMGIYDSKEVVLQIFDFMDGIDKQLRQ